jgi:hypothetical protein
MERWQESYYNQLAEKSAHPTCGDCCFIDNCARGDMHTLMDYLKHDGCLLNMKNRWDLIPLADPVVRDE